VIATGSPVKESHEQLAARSTEALKELLSAVHRGDRLVLVDSPPGAGKTYGGRRVSATVAGLLGGRCAVACQTNAQSFDFARDLAESFDVAVALFLGRETSAPDDLVALPNVTVARKESELPAGPCVIVANSRKWYYRDTAEGLADYLVVDEAYQLKWADYAKIAGIAPKHVLIGDPGQIAPVVRADVRRWRHDPAGPHVPAPPSLQHLHGDAVETIRLPATRRLPVDSARIVSDCFYRALPFGATATPEGRRLELACPGTMPLDAVLDRASKVSLALAQLPARIVGENDEEILRTMAATVGRLVDDRGAEVLDADSDPVTRPLRAADIGIVCPHTSQVESLQGLLGGDHPEVLVDTANRFQGLQRKVILALHPLSGRDDASEFHLDTGRLCVSLSRHRVACIVFCRAGLIDMLERHVSVGERTLGIDDDPEWEGSVSHVALLGRLEAEDSIVPIDPAP
jgi:AAA domain